MASVSQLLNFIFQIGFLYTVWIDISLRKEGDIKGLLNYLILPIIQIFA